MTRSFVVTTAASPFPLTAETGSGARAARGGAGTARAESGAVFEDAFSRLYRDEYPRLFRFLDRSLGDEHLAADLVQEAFTRLFDRGQLPDQPRAWLITVVNNLVRDHFRKRTRRLRLLSQSGDDVAPSPAGERPDQSVDAAERRVQVRAALDRLNERDRRVLLLRYSGYSYRDIAVALELTETAVGTILLRASARFRTAFRTLHGDPD